MATPLPPELPAAWRMLGRLLPRSIRERVYEPCCWDLLRKTTRSVRGQSIVDMAHVVGYLIVAELYGVIDVLRGRATRTVLGFAVVLLVLSLAVLLMPWLYELAGYETSGTP